MVGSSRLVVSSLQRVLALVMAVIAGLVQHCLGEKKIQEGASSRIIGGWTNKRILEGVSSLQSLWR